MVQAHEGMVMGSITNTPPVYRDWVVTRTETVVESETPFARFSPTEVARSVA